MPTSKASAWWQGDLKSGSGHMRTGTGKFDSDFTAGARFKGEPGTNPEELLGAAYAGCFSMALSNLLDEAGHTPNRIDTTAKVLLEQVEDGFKIKLIELTTEGDVPNIDKDMFEKYVDEAKDNCPVSLALTGVEKRVNSTLK